jgi:hypothetical protein
MPFKEERAGMWGFSFRFFNKVSMRVKDDEENNG